jgi:SAM-dependent methyltransferase
MSEACVRHGGIDVPSAWIARFAGLVSAGARVLDLASGNGRHSVLFAARGCSVLAVDRDAQALAELAERPGVTTLAADLETATWPLSRRQFDAVVVTNYLYRPHFDDLLDCVAPAGVLLYETFADGNQKFGKPSNPNFLLERDELLARVRGRLSVVAFEQGEIAQPRPAMMQRLAAVGAEYAWPPALDWSLQALSANRSGRRRG